MKKNYINPEMQIVKLAYKKSVLLSESTEHLNGVASGDAVGMSRSFDFTEDE